MENKLKRLSVEIPADLHKRIKIESAERYITITDWIMDAITKKMIEEDKYK